MIGDNLIQERECNLMKTTTELFQFIEESPTSFHAVNALKEMLSKQGFIELKETEEFKVESQKGYFVTRNDSSIIAFYIPKEKPVGFHISAAHSDFPCFKIKEKPDMKVEDQYVKLNVEKYGGMILSTWLDRPLSAAGRVVVKEGNHLVSKLVHIKEDLFVIPNVAIHLNRKINAGMEYNPQVDMLPLFGQQNPDKEFLDLIAKEAGVNKEQILGTDLFLYLREKGRRIGRDGEFILCPRLDDLQSAFACMKALSESKSKTYVNVCGIFDNEEVGSLTKQGANSTFLEDILKRINKSLGGKSEDYKQRIAESFLISADNAHALHPNHTELADPTNRPVLNGGIVIKFQGSQKYATDAYSAAVMKNLCNEAEVPYQTYANRSDIEGGSTLGNISNSHVSVNSVDIGLPQLAMHSANETAGDKDTEYLIKALKIFYKE